MGAVRIFKTKWLARYARRESITDASLREAVSRAIRGSVDADLGGNVIKQRVARTGRGRSGGYRMLIAFRAAYRAVFMLGFAKNDRDNITADELESLKKIAALWLSADAAKIEQVIAEGILVEVKHENEK
ncbi:MAG TPA: type II toxin-antitoxin system RelE/ParE family toxin [Rhizomicrobium sp.]